MKISVSHFMKSPNHSWTVQFGNARYALNRRCICPIGFAAGLSAVVMMPLLIADETAVSPAITSSDKANGDEMMRQMIELSRPGKPHELLAELGGTWNYKTGF